jgi:signal transduction histidine kinase
MGAPLRLLFISNDPAVLEAVAAALRLTFPGLEATGAHDTAALDRALDHGGYDVVITDYQLHWTDGPAVVGTIKARWPECPIVLFSVSGADELQRDLESMRRAGPDAEPPQSVALLSGTVRAALERSELMRERRRAEEALRESEARVRRSYRQLRDLSARVAEVQESERTAIAREIHDELGGALTALCIDIAWVRKRLEESPAETARVLARLNAMAGIVESTLDRVRQISAELRPQLLDQLGLVAAMEWQASDFESRTGIRCRVRAADVRLARRVSTSLFRIVQECLTNVARHSGARSVDVRLTRERDRLVLRVQDDGSGIPDQAVRSPGSLGLLGIQERARLLGGRARVRGGAEGTRVTVTVPGSFRAAGAAGVDAPARRGALA